MTEYERGKIRLIKKYSIIVCVLGVIGWLLLWRQEELKPFRTKIVHDTKFVYQDRTITKNVCDKTNYYTVIMQKATDNCNQGGSSGLKSLTWDDGDRPLVTCKTQ